MEYCGNCDELHNEKDCTFYMFRTEKCDSDKLFVDCDLCETPDEIPSYWEVTGGRVETSLINGEKVIGFLDENGNANLRLKKNTVLGNRTTFEFEYLWRNNN